MPAAILFCYMHVYNHIEEVEIVIFKCSLIRKNMLGLRNLFPLKLVVSWIRVQRAIACDIMDWQGVCLPSFSCSLVLTLQCSAALGTVLWTYCVLKKVSSEYLKTGHVLK